MKKLKTKLQPTPLQFNLPIDFTNLTWGSRGLTLGPITPVNMSYINQNPNLSNSNLFNHSGQGKFTLNPKANEFRFFGESREVFNPEVAEFVPKNRNRNARKGIDPGAKEFIPFPQNAKK